MEQDLKRICDAIPVAYNADISTQAHNILLGVTGEDAQFDIQTGGEQPTIISPQYTPSLQGYNISVYGLGGSSRMGGYASGCMSRLIIDGVEIANHSASGTNSYSYNVSAYAGKTATIKYTRDLFKPIEYQIPITVSEPGFLKVIPTLNGSFKGLISIWYSNGYNMFNVVGQTDQTNVAIGAYYGGNWHFKDNIQLAFTPQSNTNSGSLWICLWIITDPDNNNIQQLFEANEFVAQDVIGLSRGTSVVSGLGSVLTTQYSSCMAFFSSPDSPEGQIISASVSFSDLGSPSERYWELPSNTWSNTFLSGVSYHVSFSLRLTLGQ